MRVVSVVTWRMLVTIEGPLGQDRTGNSSALNVSCDHVASARASFGALSGQARLSCWSVGLRLFDGKFGSDRLRELPRQPGVYLFLDAKGRVLYAGKAKDLRRRLAGYRNASRRKAHRKMRTLVRLAASLEVRPQESETQALLLENQLIRTLRPPYNVDGAYGSSTQPWAWGTTMDGYCWRLRRRPRSGTASTCAGTAASARVCGRARPSTRSSRCSRGSDTWNRPRGFPRCG